MTISATVAFFWRAACAACVLALAGCGGCGGDPGQSVFGASCAGGDAGPASSAAIASGSEPSSFRVPAGVSVIAIQATADAPQNFAVRAGGALIVNAIIGPGRVPVNFEGSYAVTPGALIEVFSATGVAWTARAASVDAAGSAKFSRSGVGDAVFVLPSRGARYTITASTSAPSSNFVVRVGGRLAVNEIISPGWSGSLVFQAQERVEVVDSPGVAWSFVETN